MKRTFLYWLNKFFNTNKDSIQCHFSYKCDYSYTLLDCKHCSYCEYCGSCSHLIESEDSINCHNGRVVDLSKNCINCNNIYKCNDCENLTDSYRCNNCKDCQHCYCCDNLEGKSYMAYNVQISKERYEFAMNNKMSELMSNDFGIEIIDMMIKDNYGN